MLGRTRFLPYPQSSGGCECRGAEGAKVEDGSLEAQVKDSEALWPLTSPPGQSRVPLSLALNVSEEAQPPVRDMPTAHGARPPPGPPGKVRGLVVDVHNVHLQRRGSSEPSAVSHFHDEMVTVRGTSHTGN